MQVTTEDGYILSLQRIPSGRGETAAGGGGGGKVPVLLQHGLMMVRVEELTARKHWCVNKFRICE